MLAQGAKRYWHAEHNVPYLVLGNQWIGYDDVESMQVKSKWLMKEGYGKTADYKFIKMPKPIRWCFLLDVGLG